MFDIKRGPAQEFLKFKARLVAMGFSQIEGVDFSETHASVMATKSFRILLALWNFEKSLSLEHWDAKTAFVNAPIDENIFVHPVPRYEGTGGVGKIFKLRKALYGLRQSGCLWQKYLSDLFAKMGAKRHLNDECVYIFREGGAWVVIGVHVDDMFPLFNREGRALRDKIFNFLQKHMTLENKGIISFALDTKIERDAEAGILKISQPAYVAGIISDFNQENASRRDTPSSGAEISEEVLPKTEEEKQKPIRNLIGAFGG